MARGEYPEWCGEGASDLDLADLPLSISGSLSEAENTSFSDTWERFMQDQCGFEERPRSEDGIRGDMKGLEIVIGATHRDTRVMVNGEDIGCYKLVVVAEIGCATKVKLYCRLLGSNPITIKGTLMEESNGN
ncbi:hypothetical protein LCGC14_1504940 [marine sediment metagenome]|uniref:Uncharacterized protein n=1 Tax=marine sediment metagenome TaxID=412755 RepID=A0A0F9J308_9ZZZZ